MNVWNTFSTLARPLLGTAQQLLATAAENPYAAVTALALGIITVTRDCLYRKLTRLNLTIRSLSQTPNMARYSRWLTDINLSGNYLTQAPDVTRKPWLTHLNLASNQLTQAPDTTRNPRLTELTLTGNLLTQAPDMTRNPRLTHLYLSHNRLTQAPDMTQNPRLRGLHLSYNWLTQLPDSFLALPRHCFVDVEYNRFSAAYVAAFQQRLLQHRILHPDQGPNIRFSIHDANPEAPVMSLEGRLAFWSQLAENEQNIQERFASLLRLNEDNRQLLSEYLGRVSEIEDFRTGSEAAKANVIARVDRMLQLANDNEEFKYELLALLHAATETCRDRVLIRFNDIEVLSQFHQKNLNPEEFRALAIREQRYKELEKHAEEEAERRGLGDQIETILYFQLKLKDALNLPITTENMSYPAVSGVTDDMLRTAEAKIRALTDAELLSRSDRWQAYITKQKQEESARITDDNAALLEIAESHFKLESHDERAAFLTKHPRLKPVLDSLSVQSYVAAANQIGNMRNASIAALLPPSLLVAPSNPSASSFSDNSNLNLGGAPDADDIRMQTAPTDAAPSSQPSDNEENTEMSPPSGKKRSRDVDSPSNPSATKKKRHGG